MWIRRIDSVWSCPKYNFVSLVVQDAPGWRSVVSDIDLLQMFWLFHLRWGESNFHLSSALPIPLHWDFWLAFLMCPSPSFLQCLRSYCFLPRFSSHWILVKFFRICVTIKHESFSWVIAERPHLWMTQWRQKKIPHLIRTKGVTAIVYMISVHGRVIVDNMCEFYLLFSRGLHFVMRDSWAKQWKRRKNRSWITSANWFFSNKFIVSTFHAFVQALSWIVKKQRLSGNCCHDPFIVRSVQTCPPFTGFTQFLHPSRCSRSTLINVCFCFSFSLEHVESRYSHRVCIPVTKCTTGSFSIHLVLECGIHGLVEHQSCNLNTIAELMQRLASFQHLRNSCFSWYWSLRFHLVLASKSVVHLSVPSGVLLPIDRSNDSPFLQHSMLSHSESTLLLFTAAWNPASPTLYAVKLWSVDPVSSLIWAVNPVPTSWLGRQQLGCQQSRYSWRLWSCQHVVVTEISALLRGFPQDTALHVSKGPSQILTGWQLPNVSLLRWNPTFLKSSFRPCIVTHNKWLKSPS